MDVPWGLNSGLNFQVSFLGSFNGRRRLLPQHLALQLDVTRHACGCKQQRSKRDEKSND